MKRFSAFLLTLTLLITLIAVPVNAQENTGPIVQVSSVTAKAGDSNVAVEIFLKNNPGIAGFSFCVDYDADNLVLVKSEVNITGGYPVVSPVNDHQVNIAWAGNGTYNTSEKIATIYFNVPKNAAIGKHDLKISYRDGYDSFYQYSGGTERDIPTTAVNGYVQIEEAATTSKLTVTAGTVSVSMSDTDVSMPITISNNDGLSGFSFCIDYDESRLEYKSAEITIDGGYKIINHPEGYAACIAWTDENQYIQNTSIAEVHFSVKSNAKPGKAFVNILFRDGYDSFYKTVNKQEVDIECAIENGYININEHNFGEWQIIKEATCTETGLKRRSCTDAGCTVVNELVIPKIPHNYVDTVTEATCSSEGYTTHKCSSCGTYYVDTYVERKAHTVGEWETTVQPGCTTPGTKVKKCSVCKEIIDRQTLPITDHVYDNTCDTTCNKCGYVRTITHSYQEVWSYDGESHWHECSVCHDKTDLGSHTGGTATCKEKAICEICHQSYGKIGTHALTEHTRVEPDHESAGNIRYWTCDTCGKYFADKDGKTEISEKDTVLAKIPHSYSKDWQTDEDGHWKECSCGDKISVGDHEYDNSCDTTCNICGYIRTITHSYQEVWSYDGESHWHECSICGDKIDIENHSYDSAFDNTCNVCGYFRNVTMIKIGDYNGDKSIDAKDLTRLKKYLADKSTEILIAADCTGDEKVDAKDLTRLKKYLADPVNTILGKLG